MNAAAQRILWVAPNLNHYKRSALVRLAERDDLVLRVVAGGTVEADGHRDSGVPDRLDVERIAVPRRRFGWSPRAVFGLLRSIARYRPNVVLMPIEKKLLGTVIAVRIARAIFRFRLISYNHACLRSGNRRVSRFDRFLSKRLFGIYDRIVFYSEGAMHEALRLGLVPPSKATFADNAIDTSAVDRGRVGLPVEHPPRVVFLGRLVPAKGLDRFVEAAAKIANRIPEVEFHIIGDGPDRRHAADAERESLTIRWHGAVVDEDRIGSVLGGAAIVFLPGSSGLAINHAFAYGIPFVTFRGRQFTHGPEFDLLRDDENGLILEDEETGIARIVELLRDDCQMARLRQECLATAESCSLDRWCERIGTALLGDRRYGG